jgi:hypothetical protein
MRSRGKWWRQGRYSGPVALLDGGGDALIMHVMPVSTMGG